MKKPSASKLLKIGKRMSPFADFWIPCSIMSFFFVSMGFMTLEGHPLEARALITVSLTVTVPLIALNFITAVLLRARKISGRPVTVEHYSFVADELAMRGIKNSRRFMDEHREHDRAYYEIASDIIHSVDEAKAIELASLVYVVDSEPERAREAIAAIVNDRGVTTKDEVRALLHEMLSAKQAVSSGAL